MKNTCTSSTSPRRNICIGDILSLRGLDVLGDIRVASHDVVVALGKILDGLLADRDYLRFLSVVRMGGGSQLEHVGVITSRETSVARHHDEQTVLYFALLRENRGEIRISRGNFAHGFIQLVEVGTSLLRALFCLAELT